MNTTKMSYSLRNSLEVTFGHSRSSRDFDAQLFSAYCLKSMLWQNRFAHYFTLGHSAQPIKRIYEDIQKAGLPRPVIVESANTVKITLFNDIISRSATASEPQNGVSNEPIESDDTQLGEKLGENEIKTLQLLIADSSISTKSIADSLSLSMTAIDKILKKLKEKEFVRRVGPAKGGHWEVKPIIK